MVLCDFVNRPINQARSKATAAAKFVSLLLLFSVLDRPSTRAEVGRYDHFVSIFSFSLSDILFCLWGQ